MMKTPTELRVATALASLGIVRFPIMLSSQPWLALSGTRQEADIIAADLISPTSPPQVAMTELGSDVKKVTWRYLDTGKLAGPTACLCRCLDG